MDGSIKDLEKLSKSFEDKITKLEAQYPELKELFNKNTFKVLGGLGSYSCTKAGICDFTQEKNIPNPIQMATILKELYDSGYIETVDMILVVSSLVTIGNPIDEAIVFSYISMKYAYTLTNLTLTGITYTKTTATLGKTTKNIANVRDEVHSIASTLKNNASEFSKGCKNCTSTGNLTVKIGKENIKKLFTGITPNGIKYNYDDKISKQIVKRGWTNELLENTIDNPKTTISWFDERHLSSGVKIKEPATVYYNSSNNYIVRNNMTGNIVQVSDLTDLDWKPGPFLIP